MADLGKWQNDVEAAEDSQDFDPMPAGDYRVVVDGGEEKATKAGNGVRLVLTLVVVDGEYKGRKLWASFNVENPNPKAVEIARSQLKQLIGAVGLKSFPRDTSDLEGIPFLVRVALKPPTDPYPGNECKRFMSLEKSTQPARQTAGAGAGAGKAPWQK
jgi:hypothetical protein